MLPAAMGGSAFGFFLIPGSGSEDEMNPSLAHSPAGCLEAWRRFTPWCPEPQLACRVAPCLEADEMRLQQDPSDGVQPWPPFPA